MASFSLFFISLTLLSVNSALASRIAGFITVGGSGYMNIRYTLEELVSRGHEVQYIRAIIYACTSYKCQYSIEMFSLT